MIALSSEPIDPAALLSEFTRSASGCGAVVSFTGLVREDGSVSELWLDHHEALTTLALKEIGVELHKRFAVQYSMIIHRIGSLFVGEPIVFVAAAATHRRAAFDAVDFVMDRLKTSIPLWKRETRSDGDHWIEARAPDHAAAARWDHAHD